MSYYIPVTGRSIDENGSSWRAYWAQMPHFEEYDYFGFSSADMHNPLRARFEPVTGIAIDQFEEQIKKQQMTQISMGTYAYSQVTRDKITNQLYLQIGQTGCAAYFKIYQS